MNAHMYKILIFILSIVMLVDNYHNINKYKANWYICIRQLYFTLLLLGYITFCVMSIFIEYKHSRQILTVCFALNIPFFIFNIYIKRAKKLVFKKEL